MKSQILKILQMQEEGKLTKEQAAELLAMLADQAREKEGVPDDAANGTSVSGAAGPQRDGAGQGMGGGKPCGGGGFSSTSAAAAALHSFVDTAVGVGATVGRAATVWGGELVNMVHRDEGGNSVTLSRVETPRGDRYTFRGNSINVSTLSNITLNEAELSNNAFNASKVSHLTISRGRLNQCNVSGSSVSHVSIENAVVVSSVTVGDVAQPGPAEAATAGTTSSGSGESLVAGLRGVTFNASKFVRAKIAGNSAIDTCTIQATTIKDVDMSDHSTLRDARINDSAITTLRLERATVRTLGVERSRLNSLTARDVTLDRVSFTGMLVTEVTLTGGTWTNTRFRRDPNRENLIQDSTFDQCTLTDCEFSGCIFRRTTLRNLNLSGVTVRNVDFTGLTLDGDEAFRKAAGV